MFPDHFFDVVPVNDIADFRTRFSIPYFRMFYARREMNFNIHTRILDNAKVAKSLFHRDRHQPSEQVIRGSPQRGFWAVDPEWP